jgi:RNA polymerase sigma-70 factor (ECF subfamily)
MDENKPSPREGPAGRAATLGDVLYPGGAAIGESEAQWVGLVRSVAAGDQRALHGLYERSHRPVFTLMVRITGNRETAEELTLDVFHDVWRRAASYDPAKGTVLGWIMNQARSRGIDRLRFEQRKKRVDPHPHDGGTEETAPGPDEALESAERARRLREALPSLTAGEREALETAYFSGLTHTEAAARLNQPLGTIKTRIRSALIKLRDVLGDKP